MTDFDLCTTARVVAAWAASRPDFRRVWIFGSRTRGDYRADSDLDVAVELVPFYNDENALTRWTFDSRRWAEELEQLIGLKVDLQHYDDSRVPPERIPGWIAATGRQVFGNGER